MNEPNEAPKAVLILGQPPDDSLSTWNRNTERSAETFDIEIRPYDFQPADKRKFAHILLCLNENPGKEKLLDILDRCMELLRPSGSLTIKLVAWEPDKSLLPELRSLVVLAGFLSKGESRLPFAIDTPLIYWKPNFDVGSAKRVEAEDIFTLDADDLIDTDVLLEGEDLVRPGTNELRATFDCGVGKTEARRACKNCTCGLAQMLDQMDSEQMTPRSSCGNCYKGDAFRCKNCPYRGMPPFPDGQGKLLFDDQ